VPPGCHNLAFNLTAGINALISLFIFPRQLRELASCGLQREINKSLTTVDNLIWLSHLHVNNVIAPHLQVQYAMDHASLHPSLRRRGDGTKIIDVEHVWQNL
jgi:hypothetical protein